MPSSHSTIVNQRAAQPRGARPPRPDLALQVLRIILLICLGLWLGHKDLLNWADTIAVAPAIHNNAALPLNLPDPGNLMARMVQMALDRPTIAILRQIVLAGMLIMAAELVLVAALIPLQAIVIRHRTTTYWQIRTPDPMAGPGAHADTSSNQNLFSLLHGAIASGGRLNGSAPWCAWVIGCAPDRPADLGVLIGGNPSQRERVGAAVRHTITGIQPQAQVEQTADALVNAFQPGMLLGWREFGLTLPPQYPLRQSGEMSTPELLGPLIAALATHAGIVRTEIQIILRPAGGISGWALNRGWRGAATALKLALEQKLDYALAPDIIALNTKLAGAAYEVTIRAVALAGGPSARADVQATLDTIADTLGAYQARTGNALQRLIRRSQGFVQSPSVYAARKILARIPRFAAPPIFLIPVWPWRPPDILAATELIGLWHLPGADLGQLIAWLTCRHLPAPPHAFIPQNSPAAETLPGAEERITFGYARRTGGSEAPVGPTLRDLRQVLHITAGMGAGKSRLLANLCRQCLPYGFALLDGKGDDREGSLVATVRRLIPLHDEGRLAIIDVLDAEWPVGLNPLANTDITRPGGADLALGQILATLARLDPETWSKAPGMQQFAQMAGLLVLEGETHPTFAHVKRALVDDLYRATLLERAGNPEVITFWRETFPRLGDGQRSSKDALLRRFDLLLTSETTRHLVTQPEPTLDLQKAIEEGLIILVPLPDLTLGGLAGAIGMLVLQAFVRAAFARQGADQTRTSYPLIVDELQVLLGGDTTDIATAITRLRSLGIPAIYAHQALTQLGDLKDLMLINAANRVILQTQEPDASVYARMYAASGLTAADIARQDSAEHQYAVLRCAGISAGPFSLRPLAWPAPEETNPARYSGPDWRTIMPDSPDPIDPLVVQLVYQNPPFEQAVRELAHIPEHEWCHVLARWNAIRSTQRAYILRYPGCILNRMERQVWLSRLLVARPVVLAAAEYARGRGQ